MEMNLNTDEKEAFITNLKIKKVRNIENLEIPVGEDERKHLIFTGKNGSGKTSVLEEIKKFLKTVESGQLVSLNMLKESIDRDCSQLNLLEEKDIEDRDSFSAERLKDQIAISNELISRFGETELAFSISERLLTDLYKENKLVFAYFPARRDINFQLPTGIEKVTFKQKKGSEYNFNKKFIQYIVNLKADKSFARDDNDSEAVNAIETWFNTFESWLKKFFEHDDLVLHFDRKSYNFTIRIPGHEPFDFTTLSDGYAALLDIVTELLLRMEVIDMKNYDAQGVVLIDEIETHLHVALQKKVLPFLVDFFPKIQFIVTTHSPFVLSSLDNTTICDLATGEVLHDLSAYPYETLVEAYFETDLFSEKIKEKIKQFEFLALKSNRPNAEEAEYRALEKYFTDLPLHFISPELRASVKRIKLTSTN